MPTPKPSFLKVAVNPEVKREIDIIAASEQRPVYAVVSDMLEIYKATTEKRKKITKRAKVMTVAEFISTQ
jgi:hypothetical protein